MGSELFPRRRSCGGAVTTTRGKHPRGIWTHSSPPDDHLTAGLDRRLKESWAWSIRCARRWPGIRHRIVTPAGVEVGRGREPESAPNDHFTPGPDHGVIDSSDG